MLYNSENLPIGQTENMHLGILEHGRGGRTRRYTRISEVQKMAIRIYHENGRGITFNDLISNKLALHKQQAQLTLKYCFRRGTLFTTSNCKPQKYYPTCIKSEILKAKLAKNTQVGVAEVRLHNDSHLSKDAIIDQSLEGYVLPLLPKAPIYIHKIHFKVKISPQCYNEITLPKSEQNQGKEHVEVIGKVRVSYRLYPSGTVMVFTESSNNPFKIENDVDRSRIIAFFGQVRDRLVVLLMDRHERLIPDIMEWELTQCDINKDVKVSDWFHLSSIKVQVRHLDRLFCIYIRSMGADTVCRVEERKSMKQTLAIEFIDKIFNPFENAEKLSNLLTKLDRLSPKIEQLLRLIEIFGYHYDGFPIYLRQEINTYQDGH